MTMNTSAPSDATKGNATAGARAPSPKDMVRTSSTNATIRCPLSSQESFNQRVAHPMVPSWGGVPQAPGRTSPNGDPFAATKHHKSRLSGDASDFKPAGAVAGNVQDKKPSPITMLARDSEADEGPVIVTSPQHVPEASKVSLMQHPVGARTKAYSPTRPREFYTTDVGENVGFRGGHFIKIDNVQKAKADVTFQLLNTQFGWSKKVYSRRVAQNSTNFYTTHLICFDDLRDADVAKGDVEITDSSWQVSHIAQNEFASAKSTDEKQPSTSYFDGQVLFETTFQGLSDDFNKDAGQKAVETLAATFGEIHAFNSVNAASTPRWQYRVEYKSIRSSKAAIARLMEDTPIVRDDWSITAKAYTANTLVTANITPPKAEWPETYVSPTGRTAWTINEFGEQTMMAPTRVVPPVLEANGGVTISSHHQRWASDPVVHAFPAFPMAGPPHVPSYNGNTANPAYGASYASVYGPNGTGYTNLNATYHNGNGPSNALANVNVITNGGGHANAHITGYGNGYANGHGSANGSVAGSVNGSMNSNGSTMTTPQTVVKLKIEQGLDVRTTVMLRNIPNKLSIWQLKDIIDRSAHGTYDFMYLRMDFTKMTNVGYAFINFIDPEFILGLVADVVGKPWVGRSIRTAEISYATIQGLDCLIEKFRNSAVMIEAPDYRPKLFFTIDNASEPGYIGIEQKFPEPNNQSKKARSVDNAGTIGLYAPRSSHMNRHRHSQFDRGTTAQLREDSQYHMSPSPARYGYGTSTTMAIAPPPTAGTYNGTVMATQTMYDSAQYGYGAQGYAAPPNQPQVVGYSYSGRAITGYDEFGFPIMEPDNARAIMPRFSGALSNVGNGNHSVGHAGSSVQLAQHAGRYPYVDQMPEVVEDEEPRS